MIEILTTYSHTLMVDQYKKKHKNQLSPSYKRKTEGQVLKKFSVSHFATTYNPIRESSLERGHVLRIQQSGLKRTITGSTDRLTKLSLFKITLTSSATTSEA